MLKQDELLKMPFDYEAHTVDIRHAENREKQFVEVFPNGKIPSLIDPNGPNGQEVHMFESGAILMYLAERYDALMPKDPIQRLETMKWLFWGSASVSPQFKLFGYYYKYCPHQLPYCIGRYSKECHRLLQTLESHLAFHKGNWVTGGSYSVADIAIWPWVYALEENYGDAYENIFGSFNNYPHVKEWYKRCRARPANQKSLDVCPFIMET